MGTDRPEVEVAAWRAKDPIEIFSTQLRSDEDLSSEEFEAIKSGVAAEVEAAVIFAQQSSVPDAQALLEDVFV